MKTLLFSALLVLVSCATTSKQVSVLAVATPLPAGTTVEVMGAAQPVPTGAKYLGAVKIGDNMTAAKHCTYAKVVADAQDQARAMGGNLLQIKKHTEPNMASTCHRIECDVYLLK